MRHLQEQQVRELFGVVDRRNAIAAGALPGLSWIAFAGILGGAAIGVEGALWLSLPVVAIGFGAAAGAATMFRRVAPREGRGLLLVQLIGAQAGWLMVSALRLGLAMSAVGLAYEPTQAISLSVAGATTTAIGFVPGGLGIREALIAALPHWSAYRSMPASSSAVSNA